MHGRPNIYLTSADNVCLSRQQIDDFPLALVAPLRTEHHRHFIPVVAAWTLLSRRGRLVRGFVVFARPVERHGGDGVSPFVSRRLNGLRGRHCHICTLTADDVRARRAQVRRCALTSCLQGCWEKREDSLSTTASYFRLSSSYELIFSSFVCFQLSQPHLGITVREELPETTSGLGHLMRDHHPAGAAAGLNSVCSGDELAAFVRSESTLELKSASRGNMLQRHLVQTGALSREQQVWSTHPEGISLCLVCESLLSSGKALFSEAVFLFFSLE